MSEPLIAATGIGEFVRASSANGTAPWRRRWLGGKTYWLFQLAGWGALAASWIVLGLDQRVVFVREMIIRNLGFGLAGGIASHLLRLSILIIQTRARSPWTMLPWLLLALAGCSGALIGLGAWVAALVPPFNNPGTYLVRFFQVFTFLLGWAGLYFAFTTQRNYQREMMKRLELDAALREAEVRALKSQINPHFLFNCLNSLRALVPLELSRPREAITLLADLLRAALTVGEQTVISLAKEFETVDTYLALEQIRHEERLCVKRSIAPATRDQMVPPFLIQSLVENAVKYGIATCEAGGEIGITTELRERGLFIRITNPGQIVVSGESTGLGLNNARVRLRHLFGERAILTLTQETPDLVAAEVLIPARADSLP